MYDAVTLHDSAKRIRDAVWNVAPGKPAHVARRWFKSPEGEQALIGYMLGMREATTDAAHLLVMQIYAMRVEIASRPAGWRIELDASPHAGQDEMLSTDYQ